jgi:alpha-tubulin suppressor-like RCC1 family protein
MAIAEKTISNAKGFTFIQTTTPAGTITENDTWYNPSVPEVKIYNNYSWKLLSEVNTDISANYGGLWVCGYNVTGILGDATTITKSSPIQIGAITTWQSSTGGWYESTHAITTDGKLYGTGRNSNGVIGDGTTDPRTTLYQVGTLTTWKSISCRYVTAHAIKNDGSLWSWGLNYFGGTGQCFGDNASENSRSVPGQVGALLNWKQVTTGQYYSTAVKTDGTLWSWGKNEEGGLGLNDVIYRSSATQVGALTTWASVSGGFDHTLAIKTDGTLWTWGQNAYGALGDKTTITKSSPVQVGSLTTWSSISCADNSSFGITSDGKLWAWGYDGSYGGLGIGGSNYHRSSPVQVGALTTWRMVSVGFQGRTTAVKTDGTMWSWGNNNYGELGLGNTTSRNSPVQVGSLATWKYCEFGSDYILMAIRP